MSESLAPATNDLSRPFWSAAAEGRLVLPHCLATGQPFWPPAPSSPFRTAGAVEWREVEPAGTVLSLVVYRRAFQAVLAAQIPYGVALVEVSPNVRLLAHVKDPDGETAPAPGSLVGLSFRPLIGSGVPVLTVSQSRAAPA